MLPLRIAAGAFGALALIGCQAKEQPSLSAAANPAPWTDPSPHRQGFVTGNGARLDYLDWGGSGPPLILVHGNGQNAHVFDDLAVALGGEFRVIAYTRRGFGRSSKEGPFDTAVLTEDLQTVMDSVGIARASLAGWSLGGNEITMMAAKHPDRVDRLVYLEAAYDWADPAMAAAFAELPVAMAPPATAMASLDSYRAWFMGSFLPGVADWTQLEAFVRDLVDVQPDGTVRPVTSDTVVQAVVGMLLRDRRDYSKVKAPALAIYTKTFFDTAHGDSAQRARVVTWETRHMAPFRERSIARVKRELGSVEVAELPGTHGDFVITARAQLVLAMRKFLTGRP
jgi:pimeloyl-ACP methyl ester carboxylesterase